MCNTHESEQDGIWLKAVEVHNHTKAMHLEAEELDPEWKFFVPTMIQQRDALDHFMRAKAAEMKVIEKGDRQAYIATHLDKALAHLYRGFFDIADWLGVLYRMKIAETVKDYSNDVIDAVIPTYYSSIRPDIETISRQIAEARARKDIGNDGPALIEDVEVYRGLVDQLSEYWETFLSSIPVLEERQRKDNAEKQRRTLKSWGKAILLAIISAILAAVATLLISGAGAS